MNTRACLAATVFCTWIGSFAAACGHRSLGSQPVDLPDTDGFFVRPGAPHPLGCTIDTDCVSAPGVNPDNGCCDTGVPVRPLARAYVDWRWAWVRENCEGVECPILPPPAPMPPCALEGRCVEGRCTGNCP
jgi:hypothetical protein